MGADQKRSSDRSGERIDSLLADDDEMPGSVAATKAPAK